MSLRFRYLVATFVVLAVCIPLVSQKQQHKANPTKPAATAASSEVIERGRYLVHNAGLCADCHTPRTEKGEPVVEQELMGAPIMFKPSVPIPIPWAEQAPRIAGLPGWSDEAAVKFLMTGEDLTGKQPRAPMPPYRFNRKDAEAITAYLKSIKSQPSTAEGK